MKLLKIVTLIGVPLSISVHSAAENSSDEEWISPITSLKPHLRTFTTEDVENFRTTRYQTFVEGFGRDELSSKYQELVAQALSKTYLGIPLCYFSMTIENEGTGTVFPNVNESMWKVLVTGGTEDESARIWRSYRDAPISFVPDNPFDLSSGELVRETTSEITFRFTFKPGKQIEDFEGAQFPLSSKFEWFAEFTINKQEKAPKKLLLSLAENIRKRSRFHLVTAKVEFAYRYNDSCEYWEVHSKTRHFEGTSLLKGKYLDKTVKTFKDVRCSQPVKYLLPDAAELEYIEPF